MSKKISIIHPATIEKKINDIASGKAAPFEGIKRDAGKTFNKFMNRADNLSSYQKKIEAETFLLNKALKEHPEMVNLAQEISTRTPRTNIEIEQYKTDTKKLLDIAKESGAVTLHDNMKIAFDVMIEQAEKGKLFNFNLNI